MAFTQNYLKICYNYRGLYQNKRRITGGWYGNISTGQLRVDDGISKMFSGPDWFYIPDLDDLFEFLNNQIKAIEGDDRPAKSIELKYESDKGWFVVVELHNGIIHHSVNGDSPHSVLLNAIHALSAFIDRDQEKRERDSAEFMRRKYAQLLMQEEIFRDDMEDDNTAPKGCQARFGEKKRPRRRRLEKKSGLWTKLKEVWREWMQRRDR